MFSWSVLTRLGDMNATMPVFLASLGWLFSLKAWRLGWWWAFLFLGGLFLVAATKIAFAGWGIGIREIDFAGFSGHAMRVAALAPVLLYLVVRNAAPAVQAVAASVGIMFACLIGVSRIVVHAHSPSEAISGFLLGTLVAIAFVWLAKKYRLPRLNIWLMLAIVAFISASPAAQPAPTETWVQKVAVYLSGREKPFTRADWHEGTERESLRIGRW